MRAVDSGGSSGEAQEAQHVGQRPSLPTGSGCPDWRHCKTSREMSEMLPQRSLLPEPGINHPLSAPNDKTRSWCRPSLPGKRQDEAYIDSHHVRRLDKPEQRRKGRDRARGTYVRFEALAIDNARLYGWRR